MYLVYLLMVCSPSGIDLLQVFCIATNLNQTNGVYHFCDISESPYLGIFGGSGGDLVIPDLSVLLVLISTLIL